MLGTFYWGWTRSMVPVSWVLCLCHNWFTKLLLSSTSKAQIFKVLFRTHWFDSYINSIAHLCNALKNGVSPSWTLFQAWFPSIPTWDSLQISSQKSNLVPCLQEVSCMNPLVVRSRRKLHKMYGLFNTT